MNAPHEKTRWRGPRLNRIPFDELIQVLVVARLIDGRDERGPMRRNSKFQERHHQQSAGLQYPVRFAKIAVDVFLREMCEHGEEADEVRHTRFAWNGCSIRVDETPVRPLAQLTRILEEARYDVAPDVTNLRKWRELRCQPTAATAYVHDQVIVF